MNEAYFDGIQLYKEEFGCATTSNFNYELNTLKDEVINAEIVEVNEHELDEEMEINTINIIGDNDLEDMFADLSNLKFIVTKDRPQIAHGTSLKLNYKNEYELVCENTLIKNNNNNEHISHKDIYKPKGFEEFISNYKLE